MPPDRRRSRLPKASDLLAEQLRSRILGDGLTPGARLPSEAELIQEFELSRSTVREALRLLEAEGLIEIKRGPRGGISVRHPDIDHVSRTLALMLTLSQAPLWQLFEFRKLVEPAAAEAAANRLTDEARAEVMRGLEEDPEPVDFHQQVGIWSGNEVFRLFLEAIHEVLLWHVQQEMLTEEDWDATREAHRRISKAIAKGQGKQAATYMRKHLQGFEDVMRAQGRIDQPIVPRRRWQSTESALNLSSARH